MKMDKRIKLRTYKASSAPTYSIYYRVRAVLGRYESSHKESSIY